MSGAAASPARAVRTLAASAAGAEDTALLRLVRLLDSLPERGEADRVLEPARARLQRLKPQRPLRLARLLFLPLDGAIVPAPRWRRGGHEVPRSAIAPIAAAVEAALGMAAAAIRREAEGHGTDEATLAATLGARLWPAAAEALPEAPPPDWTANGLAVEDYAPVRAVIQPVLAAGVPIFAALRAAAQGPPAPLVQQALAGPAAAGPLPLAAALTTLLRDAASPGGVLRVAGEFGAGSRRVSTLLADAVIERSLDVATGSLQDAAEVAARYFTGTADLAASGLLDAERARRLKMQRHAAEEACRQRILESGTTQVVGALAALRRAAGPVTEDTIAGIEHDARAIRALAQAIRGAGDPAGHDRTLRGMAENIGVIATHSAEGGPDGLTPVDLARVVEILAGPDAAEAMLRRSGPG